MNLISSARKRCVNNFQLQLLTTLCLTQTGYINGSTQNDLLKVELKRPELNAGRTISMNPYRGTIIGKSNDFL